MEPIQDESLKATEEFWSQEPKRRGSRRAWLWVLLGVLAAVLHELTGCPRHFTFT